MPRRNLLKLLTDRARGFAGEDSGALIIFGLILFFLMLLMGGLAVDLMRYEATRVTLQNTLDRSTLAAASLDQELDPEEVVRDYFQKAGLSDQLRDVQVVEGLNFRNVKSRGIADARPFFLHLIGIKDLDAKGLSAAEQRITDIEIVLVLDVSGSMSGAKITRLRAAASDFVQTVIGSDPYNRVSIAVVPYNAQVNLGPTLIGKYNISHQNGLSGVDCVEPPASTFTNATMSRTDPLPRAAYADVTSSTNTIDGYVSWNSASYATMNTSAPFCRNVAANIVRLPNNNVATLQSQINALQAGGNTSITLGMKWGLTLLDPGARPMFDEFASQGHIPSEFAVRPFNWDKTDADKIIVLMTDGEHVAHNRINDTYKTGASSIYRATSDGNYSIFHTSKVVTTNATTICNSRPFWVPHLGAWHSRPWNGTTPNSSTCYVPSASFTGYTLQNWEQIWANQRLTWVAWQLYGRALGTTSATRTTAYNNAISMLSSNYASVSGMNASLQQSCTIAKDNGVTVYGIAFEAPATGQAQIRQCATDDTHYFDANGTEIATAFQTIAANITQLRLTQ